MKTAMIFGTFDILHYGHLQLFRQARHYGDRVVAVVARDHNVKRAKGKRAFHAERERVAFLRHLDLIDTVVLGDMHDVYKVVKRVAPDVICLGYDQKIFVDALQTKLKEFHLKTRVVRLKPYKHHHYKTTKIKQYLDRMV